jgi:hypothetical protein
MPSRVASSIFEAAPWKVGGSLGEGDGDGGAGCTDAEGKGVGGAVEGDEEGVTGGGEDGDTEGVRAVAEPLVWHPTPRRASPTITMTGAVMCRRPIASAMVASSGNADPTSGQRCGYAFG